MNDEEPDDETLDDPNGDPEYQADFLALAEKLARVVRDHMKDPPYKRDKIFQILNALASQTANILVACDDELAYHFFRDCLQSNIRHIQAQHPEIAKGGLSG